MVPGEHDGDSAAGDAIMDEARDDAADEWQSSDNAAAAAAEDAE